MSAKHLYAEFRAVSGKAEAVASLVTEYRERVRNEPGNVRFDAYRLSDDRDRFFVHEIYADDTAFDSHAASKHCAVFNAALSPLVAGGCSALTWLEGLPR